MNLNVNKSKPIQPKCQVHSNNVTDTVNIDDIINYAANTHEIGIQLANYTLLLHRHWYQLTMDAIANFLQLTLLGKGKNILLFINMEAIGADINDLSQLLPGGKQHILMDGYQLPLEFNNGIPYLHC
jgi:hypothetical protein